MRILYILISIYWFGSALEIFNKFGYSIQYDKSNASNSVRIYLQNELGKENTSYISEELYKQFLRRRILSNSEPKFFKNRHKRHSKYSRYRKSPNLRSMNIEKRNQSIPKDFSEEEYDKRLDIWDDWSKWSECSVSCGTGRKVRWRHCSNESCVRGLKKAQIKSCQLKNCSTKGLLNWLGIKT